MHEPLTNLRPVIFLVFAQGSPKTEIWRGLEGAATLQAQCGKIVIAVSDDIDPLNTDAIFWSLAYRANLGEDTHIMPCKSGGHGPKGLARQRLGTPDRRDAESQNHAAGAARARVYGARQNHLGRIGPPRAHPRVPWHGYSLGDWTEAWETWAKRATTGEWEKTGAETFAARRGGIIPETPVRAARTK